MALKPPGPGYSVLLSGYPHCTTGVSGFPATDMSGFEGEAVLAPEDGQITNVHMIEWHGGPHGYGGWTLYFHGKSGAWYFMTHLADAAPNGTVKEGSIIGHLAGPGNSGAPAGWTIHVHVGSTGYTGLNCGQPDAQYAGGPPSLPTTPQPPSHTPTPAPPPTASPPTITRPGAAPTPTPAAAAGGFGLGDVEFPGSLFSDIPVLGDIGEVAGELRNLIGVVAWLLSPRNWLRAVEFLFGMGLLAFGIAVLVIAFSRRDTAVGSTARKIRRVTVRRVPVAAQAPSGE